jgi:toxin ParE1/3/4
MSRTLIFRPEAEADLMEAALWYEGCEKDLGLQLLIEVREASERALKEPSIHLCLRRQPEVRRILTRRFPYRVFFIVRPDAIVVFAVLHAARDPRLWVERLDTNL